MSVGPIVGGIGLLLLLRVGADADYLADVLPAMLVFGLGLSATVAPLTATVLDSVDERHVGIASGVNNGVSRVAGLLAIAVLGAVISAHFGSALDSKLGDRAARPGAPSTRSPTPRNSRWRCRTPTTAAGAGDAGRAPPPPTPRPRPSTSGSGSPAS